jgi:TolA-binding protein
MASVPLPADSSLRLADQLQVLSQVAESLTYRLLELEERLGGQEHRISERLAEVTAQEVAQGEAMELRLDDTEERLARIEAALQGLDRPGGSRHLQAVQPPALQQELPAHRPTPHALDGSPEEDPFIDEGEQPFMDELIA